MNLVKAAGVRAFRTFLQTLVPVLGAGALTELDYLTGLNIAAGAAVVSFLQGVLTGLPEVEGGELVDQYGELDD